MFKKATGEIWKGSQSKMYNVCLLLPNNVPRGIQPCFAMGDSLKSGKHEKLALFHGTNDLLSRFCINLVLNQRNRSLSFVEQRNRDFTDF